MGGSGFLQEGQQNLAVGLPSQVGTADMETITTADMETITNNDMELVVNNDMIPIATADMELPPTRTLRIPQNRSTDIPLPRLGNAAGPSQISMSGTGGGNMVERRSLLRRYVISHQGGMGQKTGADKC